MMQIYYMDTMYMVYICTYEFIYTEMIDDMSTAFFSFGVLNQIAPTSACPRVAPWAHVERKI